MFEKRHRLVLFVTAFLLFLAVCCGLWLFSRLSFRKPSTKLTILDTSIRDGLKRANLNLYPGSESLDGRVEWKQVPNPTASNPNVRSQVMITRVWLSTDDSPEKIQQYYARVAPYVITDQKSNREVRILQLANIPDVKVAVRTSKPEISLIDIRKKTLTTTQRQAYQNELQQLKGQKKLDPVQRRRLTALERALQERTMIQLQVRSVQSS